MHDETLILPIHENLQLYASQYKQKHNIHHIPCTNIQHTSAFQGSKTHNLKERSLHNKLHTDLHTVTTTDIKTNIRHIHTSIVSIHLITRYNNKILRTPPPHISSSEDHHNASFVTLTYTTHIISSTAPTLSPLDLWTDPAGVTTLLARWTDKLAGGPQAGRSDPPHTTSKGQGSG